MSENLPTILVTGGAGFIGSLLCERLLKDGFAVINIDNFNDYYDPQIKWQNIEKASQHPQYQLCEGDIRDQAFLDEVISSHPVDLMIHLAAMAGVQQSLQNPVLYYDVNVNGTLQLLRSCASASIDRFIFASSSAVYGNNQTPFSETDKTDCPISPYASSKKAGELLCHVYHTNHQISVHCLRFFTVVGPRQRPDLAVHKFVNAILNNQMISLRGDPGSRRDYTSVFDTIEGIMGSIQRIMAKDSPEYRIYNLGNSYPVRLDEMLRVIEEVLGKKSQVEFVEHMQGDVDSTFADISRAGAELDYRPGRSFREAVESLVDWIDRTQIEQI